MISANYLAIFYLISGILFILALRGLSSPETSRQGNLFGIIGMAIAITVTFLSIDNFSSGFLYVILFLLIDLVSETGTRVFFNPSLSRSVFSIDVLETKITEFFSIDVPKAPNIGLL